MVISRSPIVWLAAATVCGYLIAICYSYLEWKDERPSLHPQRITHKIYDDANVLLNCLASFKPYDNTLSLEQPEPDVIQHSANYMTLLQGPADKALKQIEGILFPVVKPASVISLTGSVNTAALCSAVSPSTPCRLSESFSREGSATMRAALANMYSVFSHVHLPLLYVVHHVLSALHNVELKRTYPISTHDGVAIPHRPSIPVFTDYVPPPSDNDMSSEKLLNIYSTAESRVEMGKHTLLSDISHTSVLFRTRAASLSPVHCSTPHTSLSSAPWPLVVFVVSADMPLEHVPRAIRTLRDHCVRADRIPVYDAPVLVVLPPALDAMAGSLAALTHDFPDVEVVSVAEYRGSLVHAINELVQVRVEHRFARLQDEGRAGEGKWRGVARVAVLHLSSVRLNDPSIDARSSLPLLTDMLDILSFPSNTPLPPRLCVAHQPPSTAGALGLSVLPLPTSSDTLPRNSLLIDAKEVDLTHWEQPLPSVAIAEDPVSAAEGSASTPSWVARTSPTAQVHSCAALFATLVAKKAQEPRPAHVAATLVRYSSLPLPLTPALTQPMVNVAQQHAQTKNLHGGDALLVALDQPRVHQPQRVAVFSARDTQRYKVPGVGVLAHASAYAARAQGPGYSYTALVGLRADEVVQWDTIASRCLSPALEECSALEVALSASVQGSHESSSVLVAASNTAPYIALESVLRYSRKLSLNTRDLPLWPHAPKMLSPLVRLPDGRCVASTDLETAAKPAHAFVPLALSSSPILRGQSETWGHARVASLLESLPVHMKGCVDVVWPADLPRPAEAVPPVHPLQPNMSFSHITMSLQAPINLVRADLRKVVPQLMTNPASSTASSAQSALPPAVVRTSVLIPTLGTGGLPTEGGFLGYIPAEGFVNDVSPVNRGAWRADAMNGMYSVCLTREQPLEVFARQLMAEHGDIDVITARKQAALALAMLRRSPLGMLVESVRDSMLLVRDYYAGRSTVKPRVFSHPPLVELTVWVGYDAGDRAWDSYRSDAVLRSALAMLVGDIPLKLRPVRLQGFRSSPNWIWNVLAQRSYDVGEDFFLQINDDVTWHTKHWLHVMLQNMMTRPVSGLGVLGPRDLGRTDIFQQIMFGRRHVEIVGGYTHPRFRNYHGDDFVSDLYGADTRIMRGVKMIVSNPLGIPRYDKMGMSADQMARWCREEQSRVLSYLELYHRPYAEVYRTLLGEWAQREYNISIREDSYANTIFYAL